MFRKKTLGKHCKYKSITNPSLIRANLIEKIRQNNITSLTITQLFDTKLKKEGSEFHQFLLALKENFSIRSIAVALPDTDKEMLGIFLFDLLHAIKSKKTIVEFQCYDIKDESLFAMIMMGVSINHNIISFKITGDNYSSLLKNLIYYHPSLEHITTSDLNDEDAKILTLGLKGNSNLKTLHFLNSNFNQDGYAYLLEAVLENPNLTALSFRAGKQPITQKQMANIVDLLIKNKTLKEIVFDFTAIASEAIPELIRLFRDNLSLNRISFFACNLNKVALDKIKVALLSSNACTREVNLGWNDQQIISDVTIYPTAYQDRLSTEEATQLLAKLSLIPSNYQPHFFGTNNNNTVKNTVSTTTFKFT